MSKTIRTILTLVVTVVLFSALAMATSGRNNPDKEHHNRLAKLAFWHHHKGGDKNAKQTQATQAPSKQAQPKTAQIKPASTKPVAKKAPAANKTKPRQKEQDPKTASLKQ